MVFNFIVFVCRLKFSLLSIWYISKIFINIYDRNIFFKKEKIINERYENCTEEESMNGDTDM